ncbi:anti-sigma factor family protein [Flaviaesturariibacter terrae]
MSSKQPTYPQLTRANYEEAFLLYVDGELSPAAMEAVDAFAALHPDLHEELQALLDTRLDAEPVSFGDTSLLSAAHMRLNSREEEFLSYIDNELGSSRQAAFETELAADPALRSALDGYLAARLPADAISCPFKEELYRREEKRRPLFWLPRVAAAVLLLGAGSLLWRMNSGTSTPATDRGLAVVQQPSAGKVSPVQPRPDGPATPQPTALVPATATSQATAVVPATATVRRTTDASDRAALAQRPATATVKNRGSVAPAPQAQPEPQQYAYVPDPRDRSVPRDGGNAAGQPAGSPQNFTTPPVTSAPIAALNPESSSTQPEATEAVYREEGNQKSVRGFLRKASRFLEKRTGIKTTNDDDQLVVAGVAIKLK